VSHLPSLSKPAATALIAISSVAVYVLEDTIGHTATKLLHLGSVATWFGTQIWVTFVAGIVMFTVLPRQMFGLVQSKLFPKYFLSGTFCSGIALATYAGHHPYRHWHGDYKMQGWILGTMLAANVANCYIIEPVTTEQMFRCHKYEREHGESGQEVGMSLSEGLKGDEKYMALRSKFFRLHGVSSVLNMFSLGCSFGYLWYLQKNMAW